ncbi:hypothetical protein, partial [Pseudomonas aeruginosa]|uniref:hypothetical protein n=1 Tax=Pseudomonas aeruginosa TaxID=287 RepID=UPI001CBAD327
VWMKQPSPSAFLDKFSLPATAFTGMVPGCGPSRDYVVELEKTAALHVTLLSDAVSTAPRSGIVIRGEMCSYNRDPEIPPNGVRLTVSTACATVVPPGSTYIRLCISPNATFVNGSVLVQYLE